MVVGFEILIVGGKRVARGLRMDQRFFWKRGDTLSDLLDWRTINYRTSYNDHWSDCETSVEQERDKTWKDLD